MDPVGLFSSRDTIIQHVLQTFHRHATYDLVLLRGHENGLKEMKRQLDQVSAGDHLHQRSLDSLVEDGSYHARLQHDVSEFIENPLVPARALPENLVDNQYLMLAMDQFKDVRGYTSCASPIGGCTRCLKGIYPSCLQRNCKEVFSVTVGPKHVSLHACVVEKHIDRRESA